MVMNLDFFQIINKIANPVVVAKLLYDEKGKINDFQIEFQNSQMKKLAGYIIQGFTKWSEFRHNIGEESLGFDSLIAALNQNPFPKASYFSAATQRWYRFDISPLEDDLVVITLSDVTIEKNYSKNLRESIIKDPLTGLLNRAGFTDNLEIVLDTCKYNGTKAAMLILDIDDLKNINESSGYEEGDNLIIRVADILRRFERESIKIFRYGDDEFMVLISEAESRDSVVTIADTIFECFQNEHILISGGLSVFPDNSEAKDELIRFADMAVHYAKKHGKNNICFFEPEMQRVFIQQLQLQTKLANAVLDSNFYMNYQPQFEISTGLLRGFEALIRWDDSELGEIPPSVFIPLAEETGLILPLGKWILNTTMQRLKEWQDKYDFKGTMSVNVSPIQLKQDEFLDELMEIIGKYEIDPEYVEIEITEGVMINNIRTTVEKLKALKDMGFKISLDDFGTGYSSLNYLQQLPLDTLKIDKSFINDICSMDGIQANITSSIINMVTKMGLETIAEGVERPDQLSLLKRFNCNIVQGFLRGKPMNINDCDAYLAGDKSALRTNH
ncbi:diguanylate cyclase (GGDEF) domain-containing protein [Treponema sp. JC4]|nr:diguanylate cyclase (GGDEF) domain-containing protein [Treponema sp. JC4]